MLTFLFCSSVFVLALHLHLYEWVNQQGCWFSDFSHRVSVKQLCSSQLSESTECPYIHCHQVKPRKSSSQTHTHHSNWQPFRLFWDSCHCFYMRKFALRLWGDIITLWLASGTGIIVFCGKDSAQEIAGLSLVGWELWACYWSHLIKRQSLIRLSEFIIPHSIILGARRYRKNSAQTERKSHRRDVASTTLNTLTTH